MSKIIKIGTVAVSAAALAGAVCAGKVIKRINNPSKLPSDFTYTAHSGCENTEDNSMEFLRKCVELNVPVAEMDVTFRGDGTPVLLHSGEAGQNEGLLFEDAVKFLCENTNNMRFNLDLKAFNYVGNIRKILDKYSLSQRCFFTGVDSEHTQIVKLDSGAMPYYLNVKPDILKIRNEDYVKSVLAEVARSGAIGINCNYKYANETLVKVFRENGYLVSFWTADNKPLMKYLVSLAPDNITTRFPTAFAQLV